MSTTPIGDGDRHGCLFQPPSPQRTAFRQHSLGKCLNTFDYFFLLHIHRFFCRPPLTLVGFGAFDVAKLRLFFELTKKMRYTKKGKPCG